MVEIRSKEIPFRVLQPHQPCPLVSPSFGTARDKKTTPQAFSSSDETTQAFYSNTAGQRVLTDAVILRSLKEEYPYACISMYSSYPGDLLAYAGVSKEADARPLTDASDALSEPLQKRMYVPPARRTDGGSSAGAFVVDVMFGKYAYTWEGREWILYSVDTKGGVDYFPVQHTQFLVDVGGAATDEHVGAQEQPGQYAADMLVKAAAQFLLTLRNEIWVFDGGFWRKDADMYGSVKKSNWQDVILPEEQKRTIQNDAARFFGARARYERLRVPWKRGVIYYGPPGNGKTISIKALMKMLFLRQGPAEGLEMSVEPLYVRSLTSFAGPEHSISQIFGKARASAPCLLIFEDLDSIVTDQVRSYFLNEVDGLAANDGVMMLGSTNHLDQLDPGVSKRPSRFDRKFEFGKPDLEGRTKYCEYWRFKLTGEQGSLIEDVEISPQELKIHFPERLCSEIAKITDGFSFAYLQEAFVASLLAIAAEDDGDVDQTGLDCAGDLEHLRLWREMKKQIDILREEM